jgi:hypothetical protein
MVGIEWAMGVCVTGFLFLVAWNRYLSEQIKDRVTFEALEKRLAKVDEIHAALLGTIQDEGLLSRFRRQQERCLIHKAIVEGKIIFEDK